MIGFNDLTTGQAAVRYAALGVPVLALYEIRPDGSCACGQSDCDKRAGKHPRTRHGHLGASSDPAEVARWWRWWPRANVGAATGGLFDVWDIDVPPGDAAPIIARYGGVNVMPRVRTGSGGTHLFVAATGLGNRGRFLPGCDWRGLGGYVVLPPSNHRSGDRYTWMPDPAPPDPVIHNLSDQVTSGRSGRAAGSVDRLSTGCDPAPPGGVTFPAASAGLLAALAPVDTRTTPARGWHAHAATPYAATALQNECDRLAGMPPDSGRNHALNRAAFSLGQLVAAGAVDAGTVTHALADAAARCGLGDREAARTIASGLAAGQRSPRTRRGAA